MQNPNEEVFALFRSLRPDDKHLQSSQPVAAHKAQQRWPVLKAIAPKCPEATVPLSEEERLVWTSPEKPVGSGRKSILSVPGLSDKLTKGLLKMSVRGLSTAPSMASAKTSAAVAPPEPAQTESPVALAPAVPVVPVVARVPVSSVLKSKLVPTISRVPEPQAAKLSVGVAPPKQGLFARAAVVAPVIEPVLAVEKAPPTPAPLDPSLSAVFGRLTHKAPVVTVSPVKKTSFLNQLGKK